MAASASAFGFGGIRFSFSKTIPLSKYIPPHHNNNTLFSFFPSSSFTNFSRKPLMSHHHQHLTMTTPVVTINGDEKNINKPPSLFVVDYHNIDQQLLDNIAYDALVWASLHGLLMGDKSYQVLFSFLISFHFIIITINPFNKLIFYSFLLSHVSIKLTPMLLFILYIFWNPCLQ